LDASRTTSLHHELLVPVGRSNPGWRRSAVFDYSRFSTAEVDEITEKDLDESHGIAASGGANRYLSHRYCTGDNPDVDKGLPIIFNGPVDWNCNGAIDAGKVDESVNGDAAQNVFTPINEWNRIQFRGGNVGFGAGPVSPGLDGALSEPSTRELKRTSAAIAGDTQRPRLRLRVRRHRDRARVRFVARDNHAIERIAVRLGRRQRVKTARHANRRTLTLRVRIGVLPKSIRAIAIDHAGNNSNFLRMRIQR
jgi:hypothetical protein